MPTTAGERAMVAHEGKKPTKPVADGTAVDPATAGNPAASSMALEDLGLSTRWLNLLTGSGLESAQDLLHLLIYHTVML